MIRDILHSLICINFEILCMAYTYSVFQGFHNHGWLWLSHWTARLYMSVVLLRLAAQDTTSTAYAIALEAKCSPHARTHTHTHTVTICEQSLAQKFQTHYSEMFGLVFSEFELIANFKISGYFIKKPEFMTSKKIIKSSKPRPTVPFGNSLLALHKGCPL